LIAPAIEREIRASLTERGREHAIRVFSAIMARAVDGAAMRGQVIMGIDPGFRTGCKVAVIDATASTWKAIPFTRTNRKNGGRRLRTCSRAYITDNNVSIVAIATAPQDGRRKSWWPKCVETKKARPRTPFVNEGGRLGLFRFAVCEKECSRIWRLRSAATSHCPAFCWTLSPNW
jgi:uncharacterized protein